MPTCPHCKGYVKLGETTCPHCGASEDFAAIAQAEKLARDGGMPVPDVLKALARQKEEAEAEAAQRKLQYPLTAVGENGQLIMTEQMIIIKREGISALILQGFKGDKYIPIRNITAVQWYYPVPSKGGYIQFSHHGGLDAKGSLSEAVSDENTVSFNAKQSEMFEIIKDRMIQRLASEASAIDDLERLANLRDRNVLTDEEFTDLKLRIMSHGS